MLKRVAIVLICLMMVFVATFSFVVGAVAVPTIYSYADSVTDNWTQVTTNEQLVDAFRYYCKSRDLTIEGSAADAVTSFTTQTFNSICRGLGIDVTALQAHLKYETDGSNIRYLFDSTGITAYNRIFAQFLQDNELEVGDAPKNQDLYHGYLYNDNNNKSLIYIVNNQNNISTDTSNIVQSGSCYILNGSNASSYVGSSITFPVYPNGSFSVNQGQVSGTYFVGNGIYIDTPNQLLYGSPRENTSDIDTAYGEVCICLTTSRNRLYLCTFTQQYHNNTLYYVFDSFAFLGDYSSSNPDYTAVNVFINTVNVINNNNYEGDTIINNDGDIINNDDPGDGGNPPNWDIGGGDGTATDGNGNTWNIKFPDFELPDLNIDWQIHGLGDKFPFSIPFDLVALVTVLNAEPEAPRFEGTINFGFTTWDYDINLEQFDTVASACRIAEILLLVFGLILVTRSIIKG